MAVFFMDFPYFQVFSTVAAPAKLKVTITPYVAPTLPTEPTYYQFSTEPLKSAAPAGADSTAPATVGGLTIGSGVRVLVQSATIPSAFQSEGLASFTNCLSTRGGGNTTQRYVIIPLEGPATITVIGASNNDSTLITLNVTNTVSSTASLGTFSTTLPLWGAEGGLGAPTFTYTQAMFDAQEANEKQIVLKPSASARIYVIKVEYN